MRIASISFGVVLLASCASAPATRMQELGPNSFMVTVPAEETTDGKKIARNMALDEAEEFCASRGQHADPTHMSSGVSDFMLGGEVELNFGCQAEPGKWP
jgi:PBP1b-binding outer membrane lipoprotein LpoB